MYIQFKKEDKITRGEGNYFIDNYLTKDKSKNISVSTLPQLLSLLLLETHKKLTLGKIAQLCGCHPSTIINDIQGLVFNPSYNPHGLIDKGVITGKFDAEKKEFMLL